MNSLYNPLAHRIYISVINDLSGDQRIHRIASTLQEGGFEVFVIGRKLPDSLPMSKRPYHCVRMKLLFQKGKLFYLEYNLRLFFFLLFRQIDILNANDLDTLLANALISKIKRVRLLYDTHEYFTEVPELIHRPFSRGIWVRLEKWLFSWPEKIYTVNGSLARIYAEKYQREVFTIRNVPFSRPHSIKEKKENIILYQGALNVGRGLELMIDMMEHLSDYRLWLVGRGDIEAALKSRVKAKKMEERVHFQGFVPLEALSLLTEKAKLGLSLEEDLGANYRFASPNKVYDYIQAGVPVLVSDLPEMKHLVHHYQCGQVLAATDRSPQKLAETVVQILESASYSTMVAQCHQAATELNWEQEKAKLLQLYQSKAEETL